MFIFIHPVDIHKVWFSRNSLYCPTITSMLCRIKCSQTSKELFQKHAVNSKTVKTSNRPLQNYSKAPKDPLKSFNSESSNCHSNHTVLKDGLCAPSLCCECRFCQSPTQYFTLFQCIQFHFLLTDIGVVALFTAKCTLHLESLFQLLKYKLDSSKFSLNSL